MPERALMAGAAMLFGKLPAHGDFVARGLAAAEREALDLWLAGSIADAQGALGEGFEAAYERAQPWRFAWHQGDGWMAGAMAPSVDAVGRRYPIMVGVRGVVGEAVAPVAAAAEALLYAALAEGWSADRLADAVAGIALEPGEEWTSASGWWTVDETGAVAARVDGATPPDLVRRVLTMGA